MKCFFVLSVFLIISVSAEIDQDIIDSLALEAAITLKLNPFSNLKLSIKKDDIISNLPTNKINDRFIQTLSIYCKNIYDNDSLRLFWQIIPVLNKKENYCISLSIFNKNQIIFQSKEYKISNNIYMQSDKLERAIYSKYVYDKLRLINKNELFNHYSFSQINSNISIYQFEILKNILNKIYSVNIENHSKNIIVINSFGDIKIPLKSTEFLITDLFSFSDFTYLKNIKLYTLSEDNKIFKKEVKPEFYEKLNDINLLCRLNVLFPVSSFKYTWKSSDEFISNYSKNGLYDLTYREYPISFINDNVDSEKIWKISSVFFESRSINGNLISRFSFYSIQDFLKDSNKGYLSGSISLYFDNYFNNKNLLFNKIIEYTERDLRENLINKISGINWKIKKLVMKIIIDDVLNKRQSYAAL